MRASKQHDIRLIAASLINAEVTTRFMEMQLNEQFDCDIEIVILRVKDKLHGKEIVFRTPVGEYFDGSARVH